MNSSKQTLSNPSLASRLKSYDSFDSNTGQFTQNKKPHYASHPLRKNTTVSLSQSSTALPIVRQENTYSQIIETPAPQQEEFQSNSSRLQYPQPQNQIHSQHQRDTYSSYPPQKQTAIAEQFDSQQQDDWYAQPPAVTAKARNKKRRFSFSIANTCLYSIAVIAFAASGYFGVGMFGIYQDQTAATANAQSTSADNGGETSNALSEQPVSEAELLNHQVESDEIRYMRIPTLSVFARTFSSEDVAPNIHDVHQESATVFSGYVAGDMKAGAFEKIRSITAGDRIFLEKGNGQTVIYSLTSVEINPTAATPAQSQPDTIVINAYEGASEKIAVRVHATQVK